MKEIIIAVRDRQLNAYMRPFVAASKGQAIRAFRDEINRPDSDLNKHPEDYDLYQLGVWDPETGRITETVDTNDKGAIQLAIGSNLIEKSPRG